MVLSNQEIPEPSHQEFSDPAATAFKCRVEQCSIQWLRFDLICVDGRSINRMQSAIKILAVVSQSIGGSSFTSWNFQHLEWDLNEVGTSADDSQQGNQKERHEKILAWLSISSELAENPNKTPGAVFQIRANKRLCDSRIMEQKLRVAEDSIAFLQKEHSKVLKGLHEEIRSLQLKCSGEIDS